MKLFKGTIRPGTVREVLDNGIIKANAPGLFSYEDDVNNMPPIMSWQIGSNCNSFSQPKVYDEVWIMNFADNPRQLYWFRKDRICNNENINLKEENVEILCNREVKGQWCTIYFSDGSGWVIGKGDSKIQIRPDGSIVLSTGMPNRVIDINGNGISIGSEGESKHSAAYGDAVETIMLSLCSMLSKVAQTALGNPHTAAIGSTILMNISSITDKIHEISSSHVTID